MFRGAGSQLEGSRRFDASSDALQQREECVPVVCAVDVGRIGLQQLMKTISHLSADPGQHMRFHHEEEAQREENLDTRRTRDTSSEPRNTSEHKKKGVQAWDTFRTMRAHQLCDWSTEQVNVFSLEACSPMSQITDQCLLLWKHGQQR